MSLTTALALTLPLASFTTAAPEDWPHLRGPGLDGRGSGLGAESGNIGLRPAWRTTLGSAYSGIAVANGVVVTMLADGETDFVIALDARDGAELWRSPLGERHLGHDGSEDGPISSPVIGHGLVYAVGPRGVLVALDGDTGEDRWSIDMVGELGATPPDYGFTTTPLVEGGLLIVQVGGSEGRLLCAFDALTGELRWSAGNGAAAYASPMVMDLAGARQAVVLNGSELLGISVENGEVLWVQPLGERDRASSGMAVQLDGERFCVNVSSAMAALRVSVSDEGFVTEELYRSRNLGGSYSVPVLHEGHLYGFKSDFLTCIEAETGDRVWRSRPPGGEGLIVIDGQLVIFGAQGIVAVARATPEG
jgi:outer membrane protein assembly factor BamB